MSRTRRLERESGVGGRGEAGGGGDMGGLAAESDEADDLRRGVKKGGVTRTWWSSRLDRTWEKAEQLWST